MIIPSLPSHETLRLKALDYFQIMDSESESSFDEIVQLAAQICGTPVSLVTLLDSHRQWFKARFGMEVPETSRDISFCGHTILSNDMMVVEDAHNDIRFQDNPLVIGYPGIRFYAGMPLQTSTGFNLGSLCVIDRQPKQLNEGQISALKSLSNQVMKLMELRIRNKELNEANERNIKMLSIITHDIKAPLNDLYSLFQLSDNNLISKKEFDTFAADVKKSLQSTSLLINNLLEWAVTHFKQSVDMKSITLHSAMAEVVSTGKESIDRKQNRIIVEDVDGNEIRTDEKLLQFLLRNLVFNANKFTDRGTITVKHTMEHDHHAIEVIDTGTGMSEDKVKNLFKWERRSSSNGTAGEKGSGLGLHLCKELIERMGGYIQVHSHPGKGTAFLFTLPLLN